MSLGCKFSLTKSFDNRHFQNRYKAIIKDKIFHLYIRIHSLNPHHPFIDTLKLTFPVTFCESAEFACTIAAKYFNRTRRDLEFMQPMTQFANTDIPRELRTNKNVKAREMTSHGR